MYKVVKFFTDLQDNRYAYHEGDIFPREGVEVTKKRLEELASDKNRRGVPLIEPLPFTEDEAKEEVKKEEKPKAKRTRKKG